MLRHFRALMVTFILVVSGVLMGCESEDATIDIENPVIDVDEAGEDEAGEDE